jgi:UDPglucose 6-dehydrogenase
MRVAIVGTGYVGLVTGACFAEIGHSVVCIDSDPRRVAALRSGTVPFFEPGLDRLVSAHIGRRLDASGDLEVAVAGSEVVFLAVGTPSRPDGSIDLAQVEAAATAIGRALRPAERRPVVVVKSTVVPGTTDTLVIPALEAASGGKAGVDFGVAVNPEFLTEGTAVEDFLHPDRIVIGASDPIAAKIVEDLYQPFEGPRVLTTNATAEMIKYASNTLLATMISFSNQIADIGSAIGGIDVAEVMEGVHLSRYLTQNGATAPLASFLMAGCGFGGSCLPKDTKALAAAAHAAGADASLLEAVLEINRGRADRLLAVLRQHLPDLAGKKVAVLGLAFKPHTDDTRESPAFPVIERLLDAGARVYVHDPVVAAANLPGAWRDRVETGNLSHLVARVDALVLVTRWPEYLRLPELLNQVAEPPLLVDGRRMISPSAVPRYDGIGL